MSLCVIDGNRYYLRVLYIVLTAGVKVERKN